MNTVNFFDASEGPHAKTSNRGTQSNLPQPLDTRSNRDSNSEMLAKLTTSNNKNNANNNNTNNNSHTTKY